MIMKKIQEYGGIIATALIMFVNIGLLYGNLSKDIEIVKAGLKRTDIEVSAHSVEIVEIRRNASTIETEMAKMNTKIDFIIKVLEERK